MEASTNYLRLIPHISARDRPPSAACGTPEAREFYSKCARSQILIIVITVSVCARRRRRWRARTASSSFFEPLSRAEKLTVVGSEAISSGQRDDHQAESLAVQWPPS